MSEELPDHAVPDDRVTFRESIAEYAERVGVSFEVAAGRYEEARPRAKPRFELPGERKPLLRWRVYFNAKIIDGYVYAESEAWAVSIARAQTRARRSDTVDVVEVYESKA